MFIERFFCRYLCPLGAIFAVASKLRIFDISKKRDKCGKCRACTNSCSMGISMYKHDKIKSGECINCFKCLDACPRKNTKAELLGEHVNPALAACLAIGGFTALYSGTSFISKNIITPAAISSNVQGAAVNNQPANNTTANTTNNSSNTGSVSNNTSANSNSSSGSSVNSKYKDGTYNGTGIGFRPDLQVQVTIKSGKIKDIQITSSNDTPRFSDQAFAVVPNEIIQAQSTQVDAVSGATRSSNGVKQAVENALSKANM